VKASPIARRIARERGVDLHTVTGSGPGGRVVKADVEHADPSATAPAAPAQAGARPARAHAPRPSGPWAPPAPPAAAPAPGPTGKGEVTVQELTRTQQLIARRMAESKATVPRVHAAQRDRHGALRRAGAPS